MVVEPGPQRSTSVGDVVILDNAAFLCCACGWSRCKGIEVVGDRLRRWYED
jgi:hypothetical protein